MLAPSYCNGTKKRVLGGFYGSEFSSIDSIESNSSPATSWLPVLISDEIPKSSGIAAWIRDQVRIFLAPFSCLHRLCHFYPHRMGSEVALLLVASQGDI
jgi:hypothetical protein